MIRHALLSSLSSAFAGSIAMFAVSIYGWGITAALEFSLITFCVALFVSAVLSVPIIKLHQKYKIYGFPSFIVFILSGYVFGAATLLYFGVAVNSLLSFHYGILGAVCSMASWLYVRKCVAI